MTWGSFSGVSGTIVLQEEGVHEFKLTGTGKQNLRGGQLIAMNLFNEANSKVQKIIAKARELAQ